MFSTNKEEVVGDLFPLKGSGTLISLKMITCSLELGCGKGEYSVGLAERYPNKIDIKGARFWRGAKTAIDEGLQNVAIRTELINHIFAEDEVDEIWITFQILKSNTNVPSIE
jgi:tRNA (guanine-N7-)-methyltransferase